MPNLKPIHGAVAEFCKCKELILKRKEQSHDSITDLVTRRRELEAQLLVEMTQTGATNVGVDDSDGVQWYVRAELTGSLPMTDTSLLDTFASIQEKDITEMTEDHLEQSVDEIIVLVAKTVWKRRAIVHRERENRRRIVLTKCRARNRPVSDATPNVSQLASAFMRNEASLKSERSAVRRDTQMPLSVCKEKEAVVIKTVRESNPESLVQHVHMRTRDAENIYSMQCAERKVRPRFCLKVFLAILRNACHDAGIVKDCSFQYARDMPRIAATFERALHRFQTAEPDVRETLKFHVARKSLAAP